MWTLGHQKFQETPRNFPRQTSMSFSFIYNSRTNN